MASKKKLKVLFVSAEVSPFVKSGGLGDVSGSLPKELKKLGADVRVVLPKYRTIREETLSGMEYIDSFQVHLGWRRQSASIFRCDRDVPVYLIENDFYFGRDGLYGYGDDFERFAFFSKAALEFLTYVDFQPDIVHFNDWQTGPGCVYLKDIFGRFLFYSKMKSLFTIHNLQYQGIFGREILWAIDLNDGYFVSDKLEFHNNVNYMKAGLTYCDHISTVSETYAQEIQTYGFSYGLDGILQARDHQLSGILNGIDIKDFDPLTDKRIAVNFGPGDVAAKRKNKLELQKQLSLPQREDVPMLGIISRLVDQKGFDLIAWAINDLMSRDIQIVVLGTGDGRYEHLFRHMAGMCPQKVSANICFDEVLAQRIYAASDFFLMPSLFEPCGLGQLFAMRYGALPIVRKTGGLADTVKHFQKDSGEGNGFVFEDYLVSGLMWAVNTALDTYYDAPAFKKAVHNAMKEDFSWKRSAEKYVELYNKILGR